MNNTDEIKKLWNMKAEEFNEWRMKNDLPLLFKYLSTKLPRYYDWLAYNKIDESFLLKVVPSGGLFREVTGPQVIAEYIDHDGRTITTVCYCSEKEIERTLGMYKRKLLKVIPFEPYLKWAKRNIENKDFIAVDADNDEYGHTFIYNSWVNLEPAVSRAYLFKELPVLKLGGITLKDRFQYKGRNLDFTDLDYLTITGDTNGGYFVNIAYSSCKEIKIIDADLHHINFFNVIWIILIAVTFDYKTLLFPNVIY